MGRCPEAGFEELCLHGMLLILEQDAGGEQATQPRRGGQASLGTPCRRHIACWPVIAQLLPGEGCGREDDEGQEHPPGGENGAPSQKQAPQMGSSGSQTETSSVYTPEGFPVQTALSA